MEVDPDFPPLDKQNAIGDLGFRVLALKERPANIDGDTNVTVSVQ